MIILRVLFFSVIVLILYSVYITSSECYKKGGVLVRGVANFECIKNVEVLK